MNSKTRLRLFQQKHENILRKIEYRKTSYAKWIELLSGDKSDLDAHQDERYRDEFSSIKKELHSFLLNRWNGKTISLFDLIDLILESLKGLPSKLVEKISASVLSKSFQETERYQESIEIPIYTNPTIPDSNERGFGIHHALSIAG